MSSVATDTRVQRPSERILALPERARRQPRLAYAAVVALGAVVILAGLGRSSFFIDEIFSWNASDHGLSGIADAVQGQEVTPPLYYLILHGWIVLTGAESEFMLRLPSALAGIALVGAVAWLGTVVAGRRTGVIAGLLTALSPLVLQYAQEVRAYVFVMLAVTVAAAAVVRLSQEPERRRWLWLAIGATVTAVLLHYTAVLVLFPLSVWLLRERQVSLRARLAVSAAMILPFLALVPLLLIQLGAGHHNAQADAYARITPVGLLRLFSTPFDGRALADMTVSYELGFLALVDAVALLALADRFRHLRTRWMLVGACVLPLIAILVVSAFLQPLALTRYTAVAAPFMLVALGIVVLRVPRGIGVALLVLAITAGAIGVGAAQTPAGQWPDVRSAMRETADQWRPGDVVIGLENLAFNDSMTYYDREMPAGAPDSMGFFSAYDAFNSAEVSQALAEGNRVWVVSSPPTDPTALRTAAGQQGAVVRAEQQYGGSYPVQVNRIGR
jgi:mannosyltransferase